MKVQSNRVIPCSSHLRPISWKSAVTIPHAAYQVLQKQPITKRFTFNNSTQALGFHTHKKTWMYFAGINSTVHVSTKWSVEDKIIPGLLQSAFFSQMGLSTIGSTLQVMELFIGVNVIYNIQKDEVPRLPYTIVELWSMTWSTLLTDL